MGKAILSEVLAVFLSESAADFITEQVAVFNRNGGMAGWFGGGICRDPCSVG
jgi:hypothetical protein